MVKGIGHIAYHVFDMERSLKFYKDAFGINKAFEIFDNENKPWIEYLKVCDGQFIELFYNREGSENTGSYSHLCLEVDDIHEAAAHIEKCGITLDSPPTQGKDGNWQCWVSDPDGNRIELMQYTAEALQLK